jgi:hypothetical protein
MSNVRLPEWFWKSVAALALMVAGATAATLRAHENQITETKIEVRAIKDAMREIREDTREIRKALGIGRGAP